MIPLKTAYECRQGDKVYYKKTMREAIHWLKENGGGEFYHLLKHYVVTIK